MTAEGLRHECLVWRAHAGQPHRHPQGSALGEHWAIATAVFALVLFTVAGLRSLERSLSLSSVLSPVCSPFGRLSAGHLSCASENAHQVRQQGSRVQPERRSAAEPRRHLGGMTGLEPVPSSNRNFRPVPAACLTFFPSWPHPGSARRSRSAGVPSDPLRSAAPA